VKYFIKEMNLKEIPRAHNKCCRVQRKLYLNKFQIKTYQFSFKIKWNKYAVFSFVFI